MATLIDRAALEKLNRQAEFISSIGTSRDSNELPISQATNPDTGVTLPTMEGIDETFTGKLVQFDSDAAAAIVAAGYELVGDFSDVTKVEITAANQVYTSVALVGKEAYLWRAVTFPYTPTGNDPTQAPELGNWVLVDIGELNNIARSFNTANTNVVSSISGNVAQRYLFSADQQIIYRAPFEAIGKTITSLIVAELTTSDASVYTLQKAVVNELENIAHSLNKNIADVGYGDPGEIVKDIVFVADQQVVYSVPAGAIGKFISSVSGSTLNTTEPASYALADASFAETDKRYVPIFDSIALVTSRIAHGGGSTQLLAGMTINVVSNEANSLIKYLVGATGDIDVGGGLFITVMRDHNLKMERVEQAITTLTTAANGAGVLNGNVEYSVTFYTAEGETNIQGYVGSIAVSSNKVLVSNIPIALDSRVIGRRLYRNIQSAADVVLKKLVVDIAENTTTSYDDNIADGSLTSLIPWDNTTGGELSINEDKVFSSDRNTLKIGYQAHPQKTGYANVAVGPNAMKECIDAYRSSAFGLYSLTSLQHGANNGGFGVHAFQYLINGDNNNAFGYSAGFELQLGYDNSLFGHEAGRSMGLGTGGAEVSRQTAFGSQALHEFVASSGIQANTAVGYYALRNNVFGGKNLMLGSFAGAYGDWNSTGIFDVIDRVDNAGIIANSPLIIKYGATPSVQTIKCNARWKSANADYFVDVSATSEGMQINEQGERKFSTGSSSAATNVDAFYNGNTLVGVIAISGGTTTSFTNLSDKNAKKNIIAATTSATDATLAIRVREFDWKVNDSHVKFGVIAQELNETNPEAVVAGSEDGAEDYVNWGVDNSKLVPQLIKTIQELEDRIKALEP